MTDQGTQTLYEATIVSLLRDDTTFMIRRLAEELNVTHVGVSHEAVLHMANTWTAKK